MLGLVLVIPSRSGALANQANFDVLTGPLAGPRRPLATAAMIDKCSLEAADSITSRGVSIQFWDISFSDNCGNAASGRGSDDAPTGGPRLYHGLAFQI